MHQHKKKVTIRDIASASGYSVYTVSSVLNNKGDISAETSEKIREIARRLNYDILGNASAVHHLSTRSIGIVLPENGCLQHGFYKTAL